MWAKICGITTVADVISVVNAQADAIGLNFYPKSRRFVSSAAATNIVEAARRTAYEQSFVCPDIVGLFVNESLNSISQIVETVGITAVQLHGDESPEFVAAVAAELPQVSLIRALRVSETNIADVLAVSRSLLQQNSEITLLLDALVAGQYGGTGHVIPGSVLQELVALNAECRLVLAGGLTSTNLPTLFSEIRPWGVDTASGVESGPGIKDASLVMDFVQKAHGCVAHGSQKMESPVRLSVRR